MKNKCSNVIEVLFESAQPPHRVAFSSCWSLVAQQVLEQFRPEETAEGVLLHQGVDPLLGQVKGCGGELHQVSQSYILCEVINVDLQTEELREKSVREQQKWNMKLSLKTDLFFFFLKKISDLSRSLSLDEILIDLLGLGSHFHRVFDLLELFTGRPELDILIAELRLQEAAESIQAICRKTCC